MNLFRTITTLLAPRKADFTKRLVAKRKASAQSTLLAGIATVGTAGYQLRSLGLESVEYVVAPEATLVDIFEQYWQPQIANFYVNPSPFGGPFQGERGATVEQKAKLEKKRINSLAGAIEFKLTGKSDAAVHLPEFATFLEYMRYRMSVEHPKNGCLGAQDGFTDQFLAYALEESRFVFQRA